MPKEKSIPLSPKYGLNPMMGQCPLCGGETKEIFLLGKLKGDREAPKCGVTPMSQPCDTCKECMEKGFMLIECKDGSQDEPYRTGQIWVVTFEAAKRMELWKEGDLFKCGFIDESTAKRMGFVKGWVVDGKAV